MTEISERLQLDTVGYAVTPGQMSRVLSESKTSDERIIGDSSVLQGAKDNSPFVAAICPHDDYIYAGRLYHRVLSHVRAPVVVLFGVSHHARRFNIADAPVFENFDQWFSPTGPIAISGLRDELISTLYPKHFQVHGEFHAKEHSLEGIAFYLRALRSEVAILPVIVPHMTWDRLQETSFNFAGSLINLLREKNWIPGRDIAFVCSNDGVHYGDVQWGGAGYAPFGTDLAGYMAAVNQDRMIMAETLQGTLSNEKLRDFYDRCTDPDDYWKYRVTWCGRFAVSFGLLTAMQVSMSLLDRPLRHIMDDYGTSVSEAHLDFCADGPAATAPAHFHHFVGYPALGYE